jgi:hypothetical protein
MVEVEVGIAEAGMAEAVWRSLDGGLCRSETDWCAGGRRGWLLAAPAMVPGRSSMSRGSGSVGQSVGQRKLYVQGVPSDHGRGAGECECECWVSRRAGAGAGERSGGHVRCTLILLCTAAGADARRCGAVWYGAAIWHASVRGSCVLYWLYSVGVVYGGGRRRRASRVAAIHGYGALRGAVCCTIWSL